MEKNTSLCITYSYSSHKSVYRIADYYNGKFIPVNTHDFSDYNDMFSPRFIRTKPGDDTGYYEPVVRNWIAVPKNDDPEKMTTESFVNEDIKIYEIVFDAVRSNTDPLVVQKKLKEGLLLPDGVAENILLAIDQDQDTYTVIHCSKSLFKQIDQLYIIDDNIVDMLHAKHYLQSYVLQKKDVLSTDEFSYFYTEDNNLAKHRYFYIYDYLPESDGKFFLHELEDYIPFFITRYIKNNINKSLFTKKQKRNVLTIVLDALNDNSALSSFYSSTGYEFDDLEKQLPKMKDAISKYLTDSDKVDDIISMQIQNDEGIRNIYIDEARKIWMSAADDEKRAKLETLNNLQKEINDAKATDKLLNDEYETKKRALIDLEEEIKTLNVQRNSIYKALETGLCELDSNISNYVTSHMLFRHINDTSTPKNSSINTEICVSYPVAEDTNSILLLDDPNKAILFLEKNLNRVGVDTYYSQVIGNLLIRLKTNINSIIVTGCYSRPIASALSYSTDGCDASRIFTPSPSVNYYELSNAIRQSPTRVILIENILDTCNEAIFCTISKDFPDNIFIFGIESEDSMSILSKSIWNYAILLNTDLAINKHSYSFTFKNGKISENMKVSYNGIEHILHEDIDTLLTLIGLSVFTITNHKLIYSFFSEHEAKIDYEQFIFSFIGKLSSIYSSSLSTELLNIIKSKLPSDIVQYYFS